MGKVAQNVSNVSKSNFSRKPWGMTSLVIGVNQVILPSNPDVTTHSEYILNKNYTRCHFLFASEQK